MSLMNCFDISGNDQTFLISDLPKKHNQKTSIQHW